MTKKWMAGIMAAAMTASLLAGVSVAAAEDGGKIGEGQTIEIWTQWSAGSDKQIFCEEMIAKFEEETGYTVNFTPFTYDMLHEKILTAAAGGNVPDLAFGLPEYIGEFYNMGILEDLTDVFNEWEDRDVFDKSVVNAMSIDGKIVGFPIEMALRAYLVHDNDLEAAGVEVPETWDDLLALENYNAEQGKYPFQITGAEVRAAQELLVYFAENEVEIASAQDDGLFRNTWNEDPDQLARAAEVFQLYKDLFDKGIVNPSAKNWTWEETDNNLVTGIVSSFVSGNWLRNSVSGNEEIMSDLSVHAIPHPEGGESYTYMECKPIFVFKDSKNKEGAINLMKAISGKEWQEKVWVFGSPRSDVQADSMWGEGFTSIDVKKVSFPPVTLSGVTQAMNDAIAKVLQEGKSPEEAATWLSDAINASLSDTGELSE